MTLRFGKANIIVTVVFFHQVLPLSLAAFLFQGRAITNFPFLLSLLSLMLICQHFFLWSFIVCPASALLALFWQLLQTCLLLCPSHICVCVIFVWCLWCLACPYLMRSLLEGTCLSSGPEGTEEANEGEESSGTNGFMGLLSANSSMSYPFAKVWDPVQLLIFSSYTLHTLSASALSRVTRCQNGLGLVSECFLWFKQLVDFPPIRLQSCF